MPSKPSIAVPRLEPFIAAASQADPAGAPEAPIASAFKLLIDYYKPLVGNISIHHASLKDTAPGQAILDTPADVQYAVVLASFGYMLQPPQGTHLSRRKYERDETGELKETKIYESYTHDEIERHFAISAVLRELLRKQFPFNVDDLVRILNGLREQPARSARDWIPWAVFVRAIERTLKTHAITPALSEELDHLRKVNTRPGSVSESKRIAAVIDGLLGQAAPPPSLAAGEAWSDSALQTIAQSSKPQRAAWSRLLAHAQTATTSKPSQKWLKESERCVESIGGSAFAAAISEWLPLLDQPRTERLPVEERDWVADPNLLIGDVNANFLKGLAWSCASLTEPSLASALGDAVLACFKKIRWHGPRCPKVGNACLFALAAMTTPEATAQLARIDSVMKQHTGKKMVGRALSSVATRTGQTPEDLAEQAVPTYGLNAGSRLTRTLGPFTATLAITGSTDADLTFSSEGRTHKSIPAEVKRDHAAALKELQKTQKDIEKMLPAHKIRLERLLMSERSWSVSDWRTRYLDHPLLSYLSRRLIWQFDDNGIKTSGIFHNGQLLSSNGKTLKPRDDSRVSLWHPIAHSAEEVRAWRSFLESEEIRQPFKQAHREIYILTDAERRTRTYSNRFAGHIVRQHQFVALCKQRGWKASVQGNWDDGGAGMPTLDLPRYNLQAHFYTQPAGGGDSAAGVALHLATDQVIFYRPESETPVRLEQIPPVVFSEVMRDADLFVAVTSIGADPTWDPDARNNPFNAYWQSFSFGDLSSSGETRRQILQSLLPRLKIANACSLTDRFLRVQGKLRTYKIHLGSGNILMEPNDQYLCIVPGRSSTPSSPHSPLFLPFEGDSTLSIILSKAFLLAEDDQITDPTITRQINP